MKATTGMEPHSPDASDGTPLRFGRYRVLSRPDGSPWEIAHGGMGITYKAFDAELERVVVLKLIYGDLLDRPQVRARFKREARLTAQLSHPHIATVYDVGSENGKDFFVMEFIEGENTHVRLRREGAFAWPWVLRAGAQVALALEAAGRRGIIHRDITPANLMILGGEGRDPALPFIKVIDFGLARLLEPEERPGEAVSVQGGFMGTYAYASPEQCEGLALDCRTDIYSLGATLWCLLTGEPPFRGNQQQVLTGHLARPPTVSELSAHPSPVADLLCWMLAKDPADRPASPLELLQAIERVRASLETARDPAVDAAPPRPAGTATDGLEAYRGLTVGGVWAGSYRLVEELPVPAGRRRFRAERVASPAGELVCLEIIDPRLWSNPSVRERLNTAVSTLAATQQPGLWRCAAIDCDPASELRFLVRPAVTGRSLMDRLRQKSGALARDEVRVLLDALPVALDALTQLRFAPPDLLPGSVLIEDSGGAAARFDVFYPLFEAEERAVLAEGGTVIQNAPPRTDSSGDGAAYSLARLVYDLYGGSLENMDRSGYRPLTALDEHGNHMLRRALGEGFANCQDFWNELNGIQTDSRPKPVSSPEIIPLEPAQPPPPPTNPPPAPADASGWTNHLGMRFRRVPGAGVDFSIWPTRVRDYAAFAAKMGSAAGLAWQQPGFPQTDDHPVTGVNLAQAEAFCRWLTETEGRLHRLPTDEEWSVAVGLSAAGEAPRATHRFPGGDEWPPRPNAGNYGVGRKGDARTSPVGSFEENLYGLYDMGGNVWEWCTNPGKAVTEMLGVLRGGSWNTTSRALALSSARHVAPKDRATNSFGFRVVAVGHP